MKKYLVYILIIFLLGGAAAWFFLTKTSGTLGANEEKAFAINNVKDINKIVLLDTEHNRVELTNVKGTWMVNGKYPARDELVQSLFEAFTRITTLCPVQKAAHDNVMRQMLEHNVKVEIYTGSKTPEKTYYVGGPTPDQNGTYMVLEEDGKIASRPYITYIPGLRGYITPRFTTDVEIWRTRILFNYKEDEIKSVSVEYPGEEQKSFIINRVSKDSFAVLPKDEKFAIKETYQQKYVRQYLDFYSSVFIEAFDNSYTLKDSVIHTVPYSMITITGTDNSENKVKLFYMPVSKRSKTQFDIQGKEMTYDIDHYNASIHDDKDFAVVQYYVFGKLLRSYKDFFFKPSSASK